MERQRLYVISRDGSAYFRGAIRTAHYVYAHGRIKDEAGYDIIVYPYYQRFDFKTDRIEKVIAVLPDGDEVDATLFLWHGEPYDELSAQAMKTDPVYRCHGLVVASDDTEFFVDARQKFSERMSFI